MNSSLLPYSVGPLLYSPAANTTVSESLQKQKFGKGYSLALCLEDTIDDNCVEAAENILIETLKTILHACQEQEFYLPKIFVRVRAAYQIYSLYKRLEEAKGLLTGYIIPKFSPENMDSYFRELERVNQTSADKKYIMPILESPSMIHLQHRHDILYCIKQKLDANRDLVLNVRVGGNDLCHAFGFRRQCTETIYDIRPVSNILSDIMTVFGMDYVISGPVFEYYNGVHWAEGLAKEVQKDRLNGFTGKTVIHPKQIDIVNECYKVTQSDYEDALSILNWDVDSILQVSGNSTSVRMNECKTHSNWARRIIALSQAYGIKTSSC